MLDQKVAVLVDGKAVSSEIQTSRNAAAARLASDVAANRKKLDGKVVAVVEPFNGKVGKGA